MSITIQTIAGQKSTFKFENLSTTTVINAVNNSIYAFTTIDQIMIDNTANTHDIWLKVYNTQTPSVGESNTHLRIKCPAGAVQRLTTSGIVFSPLSFVVTKEGKIAGSTDPDNGVGVTILAH